MQQKLFFQPIRLVLILCFQMAVVGALFWLSAIARPGVVSAAGLNGPLPVPHFVCPTRHSTESCGGGSGNPAPPIISGTLTCGQPGEKGWCRGSLTLDLSASDPQGEQILISGDVDGLSFACNGGAPQASPATCTVPLSVSEGTGYVNFAVTSVSGNDAGSLIWKRDITPPTLAASLDGNSGLNGWSQSTTLNATSSDALSGIAGYEYSLDSGDWTAFSGTYTIPDGKHTLDVRVSDNAGNITQAEQVSAWVDSAKPDINVELTGTSGKNGWYTSPVQVIASASDPVPDSGLTTFEYSLDGSAWTTYSSPLTLTDGSHSLSFYAEDAAGQFRQVNQVILVDTLPPQIGGSLKGTPGLNGWYVSNVTVTATAGDPIPGSGVAALSYVLDSAPPIGYTAPLTLTDGQHTLILTAEDQAGLRFSMAQTIKVDTLSPSLTVATNLPAWVLRTITLTGTADDPAVSSSQTPSGIAKVEISVDNGVSWKAASDLPDWNYTWNTQSGQDGLRKVRIRSVDMAGLITEKSFNVQVDNTGPQISAPKSWNIWNSAKINAWDDASGLSELRLEIIDPQDRFPSRKIDLGTGNLPVYFEWDRRFRDGTEAPAGDYDVVITAVDNLGNASTKAATLNVSWAAGVLPVPITVAEEPDVMSIPTLEPTPIVETAPVDSVDAATVVDFGSLGTVLPSTLPSVEQTAELPVHDTPTTNVFSTLLDLIINPPLDPADTPLGDAGSNILWGAAAAAAIAAANAYFDKIRREREDAQKPDADVRAWRKEAQKEKNDPDYAQAKALADAIAVVTAQEKEEWKDSLYNKISQTDAFQDSENKTRLMHNTLADAMSQGDAQKADDPQVSFLTQEQTGDGERGFNPVVRVRQLAKLEQQWAQEKLIQDTIAAGASIDWLQTGKNPPAGMEDVSEAERLAMYQQTGEYQDYQKDIAEWGAQQDALQNWLRTGENPPLGMEDVTEAERLAMYQQTSEYQEYQASMAAWNAQQAETVFQDDSCDDIEHLRAATIAQEQTAPQSMWDSIVSFFYDIAASLSIGNEKNTQPATSFSLGQFLNLRSLARTGLTILVAAGIIYTSVSSITTSRDKNNCDDWLWGTQWVCNVFTNIPPALNPDLFISSSIATQTALALPTPKVYITLIPTLDIVLPQECTNGYCINDKYYVEGGLMIRQDCGTDKAIVSSTLCGEEITITSSTEVIGENTWAYVETNNGEKGCVAISRVDNTTPSCMINNGNSGAFIDNTPIMNAPYISGYGWQEDGHYGIDVISSILDGNIYSLTEGSVVAYSECELCNKYDEGSGNSIVALSNCNSGCEGESTNAKVSKCKAQCGSSPLSQVYNYGFGTTAVVEYPYQNLTSDQIAILNANNVSISDGQSIYVLTAHLTPGSGQAIGTTLEPGDIIATMGNSGNSLGSHVHFEVAVSQSGITNEDNLNIFKFWTEQVADVAGKYKTDAGNRIDPSLLMGLN